MQKKKIVVLTDCVDVAWHEIRGAIYNNANSYDVEIEPIVPVDAYSIVNVNFLVQLVANAYPENTIISVIVNPLKERTERIIGITQKKNLIFEGTNTGAFSFLVKEYGCKELYELHDPGFVPFGGKYVHSPAVGKAASGVPLKELGNPFSKEKIRMLDIKEGTVMHIDNFGNVKLYHKFNESNMPKNGSKYNLEINNKNIEAIYNKRMMERDDNELIIYPGSSFGYTEIGIVRGNFAEKYNIKNENQIKIRRKKL